MRHAPSPAGSTRDEADLGMRGGIEEVGAAHALVAKVVAADDAGGAGRRIARSCPQQDDGRGPMSSPGQPVNVR
jgi:hypothetical protein